MQNKKNEWEIARKHSQIEDTHANSYIVLIAAQQKNVCGRERRENFTSSPEAAADSRWRFGHASTLAFHTAYRFFLSDRLLYKRG